MTTKVTVEVPSTADYKVKVWFQKRGVAVAGHEWEFGEVVTLHPGESQWWHIHRDLRIAHVEEVPL